ncbi:Fe/S biogenesis protein NfuA [Buchnera aphidicola (Takecallis arundicolens)]|uniref:NifU family protein n=1 Tax=Buchnera aphidicola TaxID=9 RepID=UPI0034641F06
MINITKKAQKYLKYLLSKQKKKNYLRISIKYPGTEYAECKISYDTYQKVLNKDIELKYTGFSIYINKIISPYLYDSKIDLVGDDTNQKLMLLAPNAIKRIISNNNNVYSDVKKKSLFNQVQHFIDYQINPMLSMHGGKIILVDISDQKYVMIRFLGGCNGCTMSNVTLKNSIEKKILSNFTDLNGVQDLTVHNRGAHSFL